MERIYLFIFSFMVIYCLYLFTIILSKKRIDKFSSGSQFLYFERVYKLNSKKINMKSFANAIGLSNAFIISITVVVIDYTDSLLIKMVAGFLLLTPLIAIIYHLIGKHYQKKQIQ